MKFSANLGFLWRELPLVDAIKAAKQAGFDAVECHWPYETPAAEVADALEQAGLPMLGLNTARGDAAAGEFGLAAIPGRTDEARATVDEAIAYAAAVGAKNVHVMAGNAVGRMARDTFVDTLRYATEQAQPHGICILIEPLNTTDAPDYFLSTTDQARLIIESVGAPNLKLMFDFYHVQIMEGNITQRLETLLPLIGHIQFAAVPGRGEPSTGELDYRNLFATLERLGYNAPLGAEYKPQGATEDSLGWMQSLRGTGA